jgi:peptidoglycan/xylan/chitin deacetylase (PgdA/CDA1 family)
VAIVPDNQDRGLNVAPARDDFWERVRAWQAAGWFIALHGYQHRYVTQDAGLVGINQFSEFAGLPYETQKQKLVSALAVMRRHGVKPDGWVAPGHSFDAMTVRALLELDIQVISDGYYQRPVQHMGATWIPQQLWRFRRMPSGVWTVCLHANALSDSGFDALKADLVRFAPRITSVRAVLRDTPAPPSSPLDQALTHAWRLSLRLKQRYRAVAH